MFGLRESEQYAHGLDLCANADVAENDYLNRRPTVSLPPTKHQVIIPKGHDHCSFIKIYSKPDTQSGFIIGTVFEGTIVVVTGRKCKRDKVLFNAEHTSWTRLEWNDGEAWLISSRDGKDYLIPFKTSVVGLPQIHKSQSVGKEELLYQKKVLYDAAYQQRKTAICSNADNMDRQRAFQSAAQCLREELSEIHFFKLKIPIVNVVTQSYVSVRSLPSDIAPEICVLVQGDRVLKCGRRGCWNVIRFGNNSNDVAYVISDGLKALLDKPRTALNSIFLEEIIVSKEHMDWDWEEMVEEAVASFKRGDYKQTEQLTITLIRKNHIETREEASIVLTSLKSSEKPILSPPENLLPHLYYLLGLALLQQGRGDETIFIFERALLQCRPYDCPGTTKRIKMIEQGYEKPQFHYRFFAALARSGYLNVASIAIQKALSIADVPPWRQEYESIEKIGKCTTSSTPSKRSFGSEDHFPLLCHFEVYRLTEIELAELNEASAASTASAK